MDKSRAGIERRSETSSSSQKCVEFNYPKPILEQEILRVQESASEEFRAGERTNYKLEVGSETENGSLRCAEFSYSPHHSQCQTTVTF